MKTSVRLMTGALMFGLSAVFVACTTAEAPQPGAETATPAPTSQLGPSSRARIVWTLLAHSMDIYGQMAVYLRLNGIIPPASRGV